ncbi:MAG: magnesium transporter MgtE [Roseibaca calidilacus]|uniref:Magnesium transporter MgtE n=1 Tax=Roseibaca calidilacus TaxID=1666912 RepID=A0A0P8AM77_9RHOB|nr:magnesium transporter [Roseibaca calidilacus]KPP95783.1 MAG: magnesium transporter MgtE [Roseibaca calidilacus]CUX81715.1 magnesium transporter [Roseibaca calidilacus]
MSDAPNDGFRDDEDGLDLERGDLTQVLKAVEAQDAQRVFELFDPLHPADIADILEQIGAETRRALVHLYGTEFDGDILSELDENIRDEVVGYLRPEVLAEAVRDMDSDDVVDLLEDLDESQHSAILDALEAPDRDAARQALSYPEYSAGRLMQREFVAVPEDWTVGQTIDMMRTAEDLPDQFYHVFLVTPQNLPTGYVTLGRLLSSKRETALLSILEDSFRSFDLDEEEGDVAYAFNQYHLISAPVVDTDGRLVGVITIDDAMAVLDEEHEEDMLRMAGAGEGSLSDGVIETTWQRLPWLGVNLLTAIIASLVIAIFETTIETLVALAVLMPIVASMGGNAGTQSMAVAVRGLATRDLTGANVWRVIRRETVVGFLNGMIFAVVMGAVGYVWFGSLMLAGVIAAAMVINLVVAGLSGIGLPALLDRLGVDPALASGTFVTTVTDVVGFFAFLGLATILLL